MNFCKLEKAQKHGLNVLQAEKTEKHGLNFFLQAEKNQMFKVLKQN